MWKITVIRKWNSSDNQRSVDKKTHIPKQYKNTAQYAHKWCLWRSVKTRAGFKSLTHAHDQMRDTFKPKPNQIMVSVHHLYMMCCSYSAHRSCINDSIVGIVRCANDYCNRSPFLLPSLSRLLFVIEWDVKFGFFSSCWWIACVRWYDIESQKYTIALIEVYILKCVCAIITFVVWVDVV